MRHFHLSAIILFFFMIAPGALWGEQQENIPVNVSFMMSKAAQLMNEDKVDEAITLLKTFRAKADKMDEKAAARRGYSHYMIDVTLGNCYAMQGKDLEAIPFYKAALEKNTDVTQAWLNLAKCYYNTEKMKDAATCFLKGYETITEKKGEYLYYSAVCFMLAGDAPRSYEIFQMLLNAHPAEIELAWKENLVQVMFALEKYKEALPYIEELAFKSEGKKKKEWQEALFSQYILLKMDEKALSYGRWLVSVDPLEPKWWKALCHFYLSKDQLRDGLGTLLVYSYLKPLTDEENSLMADLHLMLDIPEKAVEYYQEVLKDSVPVNTIKKIAQGYVRLHDREKAIFWLEKGIEQAPESPDSELLLLKGNLLYETEKYNDAIATFKKLGDLDPECGQAYLMMGYSYWNLGNTDQAKNAFNVALKHKKEKKSAESALKQLAKVSVVSVN